MPDLSPKGCRERASKQDRGGAAFSAAKVEIKIAAYDETTTAILRFANNLLQFHVENAGEELARFGINSTLGMGGFFRVADDWFGLKQHDDFGLTLGHMAFREAITSSGHSWGQ
jgi:ABC-type transporter lipoprotein component MlaA